MRGIGTVKGLVLQKAYMLNNAHTSEASYRRRDELGLGGIVQVEPGSALGTGSRNWGIRGVEESKHALVFRLSRPLGTLRVLRQKQNSS